MMQLMYISHAFLGVFTVHTVLFRSEGFGRSCMNVVQGEVASFLEGCTFNFKMFLLFFSVNLLKRAQGNATHFTHLLRCLNVYTF